MHTNIRTVSEKREEDMTEIKFRGTLGTMDKRKWLLTFH
jgi:hypothetical protein